MAFVFKDDDPESGSESASERKLTAKQERFAAVYPTEAHGNGTLAAKLAGYKGNDNTLAVQASNNLKDSRIRQRISAVVDAMAERALQRLDEALDATSSRCFLDKAGQIVSSAPVPDHKTRIGAVKLVLALRSKFDAAEPQVCGTPADDHVSHDGEMNAADRELSEQAAAIDDELAQLDAVLDDAGDHNQDQER